MIFSNITYAGERFESAIFLFQFDGENSYLNRCVLVKEAIDADKANEYLSMFEQKLSAKYLLRERTDNNGFKYYFGGYSPIWNGELQSLLESEDNLTGLLLDVIKYESVNGYITGAKYGVRINYGPYQYVKEEF
ncbi:MAG: hypothetical protein NC210_00465 [[Clostridium] fimetarium]|nr:hypothetical protein [[Clostridium] fimetarium]